MKTTKPKPSTNDAHLGIRISALKEAATIARKIAEEYGASLAAAQKAACLKVAVEIEKLIR